MTKQKSNTRRTLSYFWAATKKTKWFLVGALITTPLVFIFRAICTLLFAEMIEGLTRGYSQQELLDNVLPLGITFLAFEVTRSLILGPVRLYCVWQGELHALYDLGNQCFDTIAAQSMQFHSNRFSGSLVSQVNRFISAYERFADEVIWNIFPVILDVGMILIIMTPRAPLFSLTLVIFVILFLIVSTIWSKRIAPLNEHEASMNNRRTGQLADSITNIAAVKAYAREGFEHQRFKKYQRQVFDASHAVLIADTKRNYTFDTLILLVNVAIVFFVIFGQHTFGLAIATLVLIGNYTGTIMADMWDVHSVYKTMNRVFGDAKEMTEILDMDDDVVDAENAVPLKITKSKIDFNDVFFKHPDARETIFENFSLTINPGERIGLVGVSGSGKTTLTKLLLRFADVNKGEILIDGQNIRNVTQKTLREGIAYVPQETALFHRSIAENIAYSRPNATAAEIERAAKLANAHEFIKDLPDGYDTLVGERGVKLSGGQRQRVAIARAILKDAPILVLDEATSALDSESEALIQGALNELMKNRTSIVIAHRLSTVASLDRIVVLKDGKIVEQGTHKELIAKNGEYSKLWSRQSGAFLEEK